jgi:hypothetical protein
VALELEHRDIARISSLFAAFPYDSARVEAYLTDPRSRVFVDDLSKPTVAMVVPAIPDINLMAGEPQPAKVRDLLEHVTALPGIGEPFMFSVPTSRWNAVIEAEFGNGVSPNAAITFCFDQTEGRGVRGWRERVPSGCEVRRIDRDLAVRAQEVDPSFPSVWPDPESFLSRGTGFCLVQEGRILSIAYSMCQPGQLLEVAVATAKDVRGRGYSPLTTAPLIEHCLDHDIEPVWTCFGWNHASQSVARKLGFVDPVRHTWFRWTPFNASRKTAAVSPAVLQDYVGCYHMKATPAEIRVDGDGLVYVDQLRQVLLLGAEAPDQFFFRDFDFQVEFTRDSHGRVDGFVRRQFGREFRAERV